MEFQSAKVAADGVSQCVAFAAAAADGCEGGGEDDNPDHGREVDDKQALEGDRDHGVGADGLGV